eukprot:9503851-Pyramimonas_sp.AAC.11
MVDGMVVPREEDLKEFEIKCVVWQVAQPIPLLNKGTRQVVATRSEAVMPEGFRSKPFMPNLEASCSRGVAPGDADGLSPRESVRHDGVCGQFAVARTEHPVVEVETVDGAVEVPCEIGRGRLLGATTRGKGSGEGSC